MSHTVNLTPLHTPYYIQGYRQGTSTLQNRNIVDISNATTLNNAFAYNVDLTKPLPDDVLALRGFSDITAIQTSIEDQDQSTQYLLDIAPQLQQLTSIYNASLSEYDIAAVFDAFPNLTAFGDEQLVFSKPVRHANITRLWASHVLENIEMAAFPALSSLHVPGLDDELIHYLQQHTKPLEHLGWTFSNGEQDIALLAQMAAITSLAIGGLRDGEHHAWAQLPWLNQVTELHLSQHFMWSSIADLVNSRHLPALKCLSLSLGEANEFCLDVLSDIQLGSPIILNLSNCLIGPEQLDDLFATPLLQQHVHSLVLDNNYLGTVDWTHYDELPFTLSATNQYDDHPTY